MLCIQTFVNFTKNHLFCEFISKFASKTRMSDDENDVPAIKKQRIYFGSLEESIRELEKEHLKKSENQQNINVSDGSKIGFNIYSMK